MHIIFTKHALQKIELLKNFGILVTKQDLSRMVENPEHVDTEADWPRVIISRSWDERRILRVVYKREGDIITIITWYPALKGRYY